MKIISLQERHLPTLLNWINRLPYEYGWDARAIHFRTLGDPVYRPEFMLVAEEAREPLGFLLGIVRDGRGWIKGMVVRPDRQRQGIGSRLLQEVEANFAKAGVSQVTAGWCPLTFFAGGWDIRYTGAVNFMVKHGYVTDRKTRVNMWVDLAGRDFGSEAEERRLRELGITARRAAPEDREKVVELARTFSEGWALEVAQAWENDPISLFVAEKEGRMVNFACYGTDAPMYFGPLLTLPEFRGLGIATVTLKRCLVDMQRAGWSRIEIDWVGPIAFYERAVGAYIGRAFWYWEKELGGKVADTK